MRQVGDAYAYGFFQNVRGELARLAGDAMLVPGSPTRRRSASASSWGASATWLREREPGDGIRQSGRLGERSATCDRCQNYEGL